MNWFLSEPARAAEVCGAIQSEATTRRIESAASSGATVLRASEPVENEHFPEARTATPLVLQVDAADAKTFQREMFGPIIYIIKTSGTAESLSLASDGASQCGALTCAMYSRDEKVIEDVVDTMTDAGVAVSCNLTGHIWVNQSAAYSGSMSRERIPPATPHCAMRPSSPIVSERWLRGFQSRLRSRR